MGIGLASPIDGLRSVHGTCEHAFVLLELRVENLLLIERAEIDLGPGFNVITGETGAGKTMRDRVTGRLCETSWRAYPSVCTELVAVLCRVSTGAT